MAHPAAHLHQVEIDTRTVGGVGVDVNHILKPSVGRWDWPGVRASVVGMSRYPPSSKLFCAQRTVDLYASVI